MVGVNDCVEIDEVHVLLVGQTSEAPSVRSYVKPGRSWTKVQLSAPGWPLLTSRAARWATIQVGRLGRPCPGTEDTDPLLVAARTACGSR